MALTDSPSDRVDPDSIELSDIDLLDRDAFAERVPHEWFAHLRRHAPAYHHPEPAGPGFWVFTRHEDVMHLNRDWQNASSDARRGGVVTLEELTGEQAKRREEMSEAGQLMLEMDPPDHTRYRKLVNRGFTPKVIRSLEDHLREITVRIIERAQAQGGEVDFVVDVAAELPLEAIAEFLGVPYEDRLKLFDWSNRFIGSEDPEYVVSDADLQEAQVEMFMYANAMGEDRRQRPRGDIVSNLVNSVIDGERLSDMDFNLFFLLLSVAGNETTRNAISHGMAALLEHPDQYRMLVEDPSLMDSAIEEILRWASPVMFFRRNITEDLDYAGQQLRAGDKVSLWYISANRDEEVFDDPYTFDITRDPNPHIAFGGGGPHHCLGANLARMEMKIIFEELTRRSPTVEQLGPPVRLRSNFINGIKHLPVRLQPS
jgi:cholest-4-en-3-one 26-monooxygenase